MKYPVRIAVWIFLCGFPPAIAQAEDVDLELVLAVDSSGSIDDDEFKLQREGYARALTHPEIIKAIQRGPYKAVAVTYVEWSGPDINTQVVTWTRLSDRPSAEFFAAKLLSADRTIFGGGTALGAAIDLGMSLLAQNPFEGIRRVIDISGDGWSNKGRAPSRARDEAIAQRVTINGLAITDFEDGLVDYFRKDVIGGAGAFAISADGFKDFARAVRKKLLQELNVSRR